MNDHHNDPFTAAYREWEKNRNPTNAERAAWFREHDTSTAEQVSRVPLSARLAYFLLFGVVRPICEAFGWVEKG